ncbi:MAG TPA: DEAD/DEAH box helicase family protein [Ktedonobacteraceae bacterium]|nr:DEAD/DEAH box helicase family protein [Ktedonobacteraceae bacterium]
MLPASEEEDKSIEREDVLLEPTQDVEISPMMETTHMLASQAPASATPRRHYWQAQGLADTILHEFDEAMSSGKLAEMRERFYIIANYYDRTVDILRNALRERREPLAQAALHNLIALHKSLQYMHKLAPDSLPSTLTLDRDVRPRLIQNLIMQVLQNSPEPLDLVAIRKHVKESDLLAGASEPMLQHHLDNLISTGHIERVQVRPLDERYAPTTRAYGTINLDQAGLHTLLDSTLFHRLDAAGYHGLTDVVTAKEEFRTHFATLTNFSESTGALFVAAAEALVEADREAETLNPWHHADLIGASHVRPYQHEAHAIFCGYGYQGQVIEAPTGSGKTMIGMMCIQDWLRTMPQGQSILVLVPTVNYQQQWVGELCYKLSGLHLSPHLVFTGTPASLEAGRKRKGISPCVIVMTYTALAQTGSGVGKGGFDQDSIEIFLQGNNIQYVILDEVHKVVEDMQSVSADVTRVLMDWVKDGSLKGAIGFSGTAAAFRPRFAQLGLQLVYIMPAAELIAYGFVAPFAEFGIPFAYSDREQRVHDLLDAYKVQLRDFMVLIGGTNLRRWFAAIPLDERVALGRDLLRMYAGRKDQAEMLVKRLREWEKSGVLTLTELPLITLVQLSRGWSDEDIVRASAEDEGENGAEARLQQFHALRLQMEAIRDELKPLIFLEDTIRRLSVEGFATTFDADAVRHLSSEIISSAVRAERVKDGLATTMVGLYDSLSNWYLRVGEGRVDSMKAIIEAERATRPVHGVIIFDAGTRIRWQDGTAIPGYRGVAGVFSQMLGDKRFTPMAVLSSEMYLAYDEIDPLPARIAAFIKRAIMLGELSDALFGLTTGGLGLTEKQLAQLRNIFDGFLARYVDTLVKVGVRRLGEFSRKVLSPFRRAVRKAHLGDTQEKLLARLSIKHYHVRNCVATFFDYALIADAFEHAHVAELAQVSGVRQRFFVVKMAQGERKPLMYDLTARIVDAEDLPVNMIIVSPWARTGWNVIKPNVLIDATATRDVTAWQQLRGRAMRATGSWTNECYRLVLLLMGSHLHVSHDAVGMPEDIAAALAEFREKSSTVEVLDKAVQAILREAHQRVRQHDQSGYDTLAAKIEQGAMSEFTLSEREQLVAELMLARNKVTHIYELVKAYGSTNQVHYDRTTSRWLRTESISSKHALEYAVNPLSGKYSSGPGHAPMVYAGDPRKDVPSASQARLSATLDNCDPRIVKGWLETIATGLEEAPQQFLSSD